MQGHERGFFEWYPTQGMMVASLLVLFLAIVLSVLMTGSGHAAAEGGPSAAMSLFDVQGLLAMLLPAIWGSVGPLAIVAITKFVNQVAGTYVPRPVQVVLSSILGAASAGLVDGGVTAVATAVSGGAAQIYAGTKPETLRTSAPPVTLGGPVS